MPSPTLRTAARIAAVAIILLLLGWIAMRIRERFETADTDSDAVFKQRLQLLETERDQAVTGTLATDTATSAPGDVYTFVAGYCQ